MVNIETLQNGAEKFKNSRKNVIWDRNSAVSCLFKICAKAKYETYF